MPLGSTRSAALRLRPADSRITSPTAQAASTKMRAHSAAGSTITTAQKTSRMMTIRPVLRPRNLASYTKGSGGMPEMMPTRHISPQDPNVRRRAAAGRPYRPGRTGTGSVAEQPVADPGAGLAVVQRAVLRGERLVGGRVAGGRRAGVPGRRQHLLRAGQQGARRLRLEVEAEPA